MKKSILYSIVITILAIVLLYGLGFFHVNIASHNSYRLNETEANLIESAISRFRERLKNQRFDEIRKDLSKGRREEYGERIIFDDILEDLAEFGIPNSWELFQCAQPQFDMELNETVYHLDYLTRFDNGEEYESFIFVKNSNDDVNLINVDIQLHEAAEWRIEERNKHKAIVEKYPNEIIIPYADRYIEVRY